MNTLHAQFIIFTSQLGTACFPWPILFHIHVNAPLLRLTVGCYFYDFTGKSAKCV
jgi:hypothetical protein